MHGYIDTANLCYQGVPCSCPHSIPYHPAAMLELDDDWPHELGRAGRGGGGRQKRNKANLGVRNFSLSNFAKNTRIGAGTPSGLSVTSLGVAVLCGMRPPCLRARHRGEAIATILKSGCFLLHRIQCCKGTKGSDQAVIRSNTMHWLSLYRLVARASSRTSIRFPGYHPAMASKRKAAS
jgi:hypothetical protein